MMSDLHPSKKHDIPWKNNDVNDLLFSENDVREQLWCWKLFRYFRKKATDIAKCPNTSG